MRTLRVVLRALEAQVLRAAVRPARGLFARLPLVGWHVGLLLCVAVIAPFYALLAFLCLELAVALPLGLLAELFPALAPYFSQRYMAPPALAALGLILFFFELCGLGEFFGFSPVDLLRSRGKKPKRLTSPAHPLFELGQECDRLLGAGRPAEAEAGYRRLLEELETRRALDEYLLAKTGLGLMLSLIAQGRTRDAHEIWDQNLRDATPGNWLGIGLNALDRRRVSGRDHLIYGIVCATITACSGLPDDARAERSCLIFQDVARRAYDEGYEDILESALAMAKAVLDRALGAQVAARHPERIAALALLERKLGRTVSGDTPRLPELDDWERPFRTVTLISEGKSREVLCDPRRPAP